MTSTMSPTSLATLMITCLAIAEPPEKTFEYPDTTIGRRVAAFVETHNAGDDDAIRAWDAEHRADASRDERSIESILPMMRRIHEAVGAMTPHMILEDKPNELAILVRLERSIDWGRLAVTVEPEPPHKILTFVFRPSAGPEIETLAYDGWETLAGLLERAREDGRLPAIAAAVVEGDRLTDQAAVGFRARDETSSVTVEDRFHIGSVTKSMTATAIGGLVERGMLSWETTIGEALDDIEMRQEYENVTLLQLLQHRAGIPQHLTYDDEEMTRLVELSGSATEQRAQFVAEVLQQEPIAEPGTAMNYSNAGYSVAGLIAERAAKLSWEQLLVESIFVPLRLTAAGFGWPATPTRPDQPRGHFPDRTQTLEEYELGAFMAPAGNVHCSVGDLARYAALHMRGLRGEDGVLRAATVATLHTPPSTPVATGSGRYACGWVLRKAGEGEGGGEVHWHNGSAGTFYALVALFPGLDRAVVIVANAGTTAEPFAWKIVEAINRKRK